MLIKVNGLNINYELTGRGRNLILIHGAGGNLYTWFNQVPFLAQKYRVLTYDVRGFGRSEQPAGDYTQAAVFEDLSGLLAALDIKETFVAGFSMGGWIGQWLAVKHPETVKGLVLSNSGSGANWTAADAEATFQRFSTMAETMEKLGIEGYVAQRTAANFSPDFAGANKELVARYQATQLQNNAKSCARTLCMLAQRTFPDPQLIRCPTLIIAGEHDPVAGPAVARTLHAAIAGSQMRVFATGHASPIEGWEPWNTTVLEFLDGIP